jgi:plastocyanin
MVMFMSVLLAAGSLMANDPALASDEAWCNQQRPNQKAVIRVDVDEAGNISVQPDTCRVAPGARLIWIGPKGSNFDVVFVSDTPDEAGNLSIKSQSTAKEERISIRTRRSDTLSSFTYDVVLDGEMFDPVVIIDPTLQ